MVHKMLVLWLLLTAAVGASAQGSDSVALASHDTVYLTKCRKSHTLTALFYDNNCHDTVDIRATLDNYGYPFSVTVSYNFMSSYAVAYSLQVWDGDSVTGTLVLDRSASNTGGPQEETVNSATGQLTVRMHADNSWSMNCLFRIYWPTTTGPSPCSFTMDNVRLLRSNESEARIGWTTNSPTSVVSCNGVTYTTNDTSILITGLEANTEYTVYVSAFGDRFRSCCGDSVTFLTDPPAMVGCPSVADLHSGHLRAYYGTTANPYKYIGVVDTFGGEYSYMNRHMVHTDTTATDPLTGGLLRKVCPGTQSSVQLGNQHVGGAGGTLGEALTYYLYIDTNIYALLLLNYAVVLQNPGHASTAQPRFIMEMLDESNNLIDPICGRADFSASSSLGWNVNPVEQNVWKDWTAVGFDMTPYHGQRVKVRFTTYDCTLGDHYGYAYFSLGCSLNAATTEYCGDTDTNSITAPDGFNYVWYYDSPSNPVDTAQTVHFTNSDELLHCRLVSKENPACYVTLNIYAGHRWPVAIADTLFGQQEGCDGYRIYFINRSSITNDAGDTTGEHCESATWYFGDGFISFDYSPNHLYREPGDYDVTMIAGIANNSCRDTTHFTVHVPDFYVRAIRDSLVCDSVRTDDGQWHTTDTYGTPYRVHHDNDCDTIYTPYYRIIHGPSTLLPVDTFCYSERYTWCGQTVGSDTITRPTFYRLVDRFPSSGLCDSVVLLPLIQLPRDKASIGYESDCPTQSYLLTAHTSLPGLHWSASPPDPSLTGHEEDSVVRVTPLVTTVYQFTTEARDTAVCAAVTGVTLSPTDFPEARLEVNPDALTYESLDIDAYDRSRNYTQRQWHIVLHSDGTDTLRPDSRYSHLHYHLDDINIDSLHVVLAVSSNACTDTAWQTIPFIRGLLWAPNAFTPSEESNNRFVIGATGVKETTLTIYDRAGRIVFTGNDIAAGWDGTRNGRPCPQGAYVWFLRYQTDAHPGVVRSATGTVTLIR